MPFSPFHIKRHEAKEACNNNSQQQVAACIILFRPYVRSESVAKERPRAVKKCISIALSACTKENANQFFQRQIARRSKGRKYRSEGAAHAANIRGDVRRGLLCSCSFFTLATKICFSPSHMQRNPTCSLICFIWRERKLWS